MTKLLLYVLLSPVYDWIFWGLIVASMLSSSQDNPADGGVLAYSLVFMVVCIARSSYLRLIRRYFSHRKMLLDAGVDMEGSHGRAFRALRPIERELLKPVLEAENSLCTCKSGTTSHCLLHGTVATPNESADPNAHGL